MWEKPIGFVEESQSQAESEIEKIPNHAFVMLSSGEVEQIMTDFCSQHFCWG